MIKSKSLKKVLAAALAMSLVMAPVVGVNAAPSTGGSGNVSGNSDGGSENTSSATSTEAAEVPHTSVVNAGGTVLTTTVKGAYMSKKIPGTVVSTGKDAIAAAYGLGAGEQPYVRVYDINAENSPAAMASVDAAAAAVGGTVIGTVNLELGKLAGGKFSLLAQGGAPITMAFGIPKTAVKAGFAYAMICVRPGGVIEVLPDLDANPATVTFNTTGGLGAYAMVMYPVA